MLSTTTSATPATRQRAHRSRPASTRRCAGDRVQDRAASGASAFTFPRRRRPASRPRGGDRTVRSSDRRSASGAGPGSGSSRSSDRESREPGAVRACAAGAACASSCDPRGARGQRERHEVRDRIRARPVAIGTDSMPSSSSSIVLPSSSDLAERLQRAVDQRELAPLPALGDRAQRVIATEREHGGAGARRPRRARRTRARRRPRPATSSGDPRSRARARGPARARRRRAGAPAIDRQSTGSDASSSRPSFARISIARTIEIERGMPSISSGSATLSCALRSSSRQRSCGTMPTLRRSRRSDERRSFATS